MKWFVFCLSISLSLPVFSAAPEVVKLCYEDVGVYPWITGDEKGLALMQLKSVSKNLGIKIKFVRLPWKRCQIQARGGLVDGIIAASFSRERTEWGTYPTIENDKLEREYRLHTDSFYVYTRKDSTINFSESIFHNLEQNPIGVQLGYSVGNDLKDAGLKTASSYTTPYDLLKALDMGMLKVAVLQNFAALKTLEEHPDLKKNILKQEPPFKVADQYVVFNTKFFEKNKDLCLRIWKNISFVRNGPDYQKAVKQFDSTSL